MPSSTKDRAPLSRRVLIVLAMVLGGAVMFLLPSAYAIDRGWSRVVALVVGLSAFPVVPLTWHAIAELRRRKRDPGDSPLTGRDRFTLRLLAVAALTLGSLLVFDARGVLEAAWNHGTWWLRWDLTRHELPVRDARLLDAVPEDAHAIVWSEGVELMPLPSDGPAIEGEAVMAYAPGRLMVALHDDPALLDVLRVDDLAFLAKGAGVTIEGELTVRRPHPEVMVAVSDDWVDAVDERLAGGGAAPIELIDGLRAPPRARFVGIWHPRKPDGEPDAMVEVARAVVVEGHEAHALEIEVEARSVEHAKSIESQATKLRRLVGAMASSDCGDQLEAIVDATDVERDGTTVRVTSALPLDTFEDMSQCYRDNPVVPRD